MKKKYRIELSATAKADIYETARWLRKESSPAVADNWLAALERTIRTLEVQPRRCPLAAESHKFEREIRELLHGRGKGHKYRIIFQIIDDVVYVVYVRSSARDEIEP